MYNSFIRINYQGYRDASVRVLYSSVASTAGKDNKEVTNAMDGIEKRGQGNVGFALICYLPNLPKIDDSE